MELWKRSRVKTILNKLKKETVKNDNKKKKHLKL